MVVDCLKLSEKISVSPLFKSYIEAKQIYFIGRKTKTHEEIIIECMVCDPFILAEYSAFKMKKLSEYNMEVVENERKKSVKCVRFG